MPVVLVEKDPFVDPLSAMERDDTLQDYNVRRPLYGLVRKDSRFAKLSVYRATVDDASGSTLTPVSLTDSSAPGGKSISNHNFIVTSTQVELREKAQVTETFGADFIFFYGSKAPVLQVQGVLFNTKDFNWKNEWISNYENYLRGTKCVENRARVYLAYDDELVEGYMLGTSLGQNAEQPALCSFGFTMFVTSRTDLSSTLDVVTESPGRSLESGPANIEYLSDVMRQPTYEIDPATGEIIVTGEVTSEGLWGKSLEETAEQETQAALEDADVEVSAESYREVSKVSRGTSAEMQPMGKGGFLVTEPETVWTPTTGLPSTTLSSFAKNYAAVTRTK